MINHTFCPILGSQFTFSKPTKQKVIISNGFPSNVLQMKGVIRTPPQPTTADLIFSNLKPVLRKQFPQKFNDGK